MSTYTDAVASGLQGLEAVSTGPCPGCRDCADSYGFDSLDNFNAAYESGEVVCEGHFSWGGCDICGTRLGGTAEEWHAIVPEDGALFHGTNACVDCVMYLANGDEPEGWEE